MRPMINPRLPREAIAFDPIPSLSFERKPGELGRKSTREASTDKIKKSSEKIRDVKKNWGEVLGTEVGKADWGALLPTKE